jgi:alpha-mannosidase
MATEGAIATCSFEGVDAAVRATRRPADEFLRLHFEIDNRSPDHRVQVEFATRTPPLDARAGAPFEIVKRPAVGEGGDSEPPPRQWPARGFVVAGGTGVLGDGVFEYELGPDSIGVTLIRCTGTISRSTLATRKVTAGPDVTTPEAQLFGRSSRSFGVTSTEPADPVAAGETFSASLMRVPVKSGGSLPARGRLLDLDVPALSAVYRQGGKLRVRAWNPWGEPRRATIGDHDLELGPHRIETIEFETAPVGPG